jgi:hypothetical protein
MDNLFGIADLVNSIIKLRSANQEERLKPITKLDLVRAIIRELPDFEISWEDSSILEALTAEGIVFLVGISESKSLPLEAAKLCAHHLSLHSSENSDWAQNLATDLLSLMPDFAERWQKMQKTDAELADPAISELEQALHQTKGWA